MRQPLLCIATIALLSACSADQSAPPAPMPAAKPAPSEPAAAPPVPATPPAATRTGGSGELPPYQTETPPPFVDRVWRVTPGGEQEAGTTYTFLRDGTLLVDAPSGTPSKGSWRYAGDKVTMVEEGVAHPADVVTLDATHFVLRSYNPGGSVDIVLALDPNAPLPQVPY